MRQRLDNIFHLYLFFNPVNFFLENSKGERENLFICQEKPAGV